MTSVNGPNRYSKKLSTCCESFLRTQHFKRILLRLGSCDDDDDGDQVISISSWWLTSLQQLSILSRKKFWMRKPGFRNYMNSYRHQHSGISMTFASGFTTLSHLLTGTLSHQYCGQKLHSLKHIKTHPIWAVVISDQSIFHICVYLCQLNPKLLLVKSQTFIQLLINGFHLLAGKSQFWLVKSIISVRKHHFYPFLRIDAQFFAGQVPKNVG